MKLTKILGIFLFCCFLSTIFWNHESLAQDGWIRLFYDNFDDGIADGWVLNKIEPDSSWVISKDGSNYFLEGKKHCWGKLQNGEMRSDYSFKCKVQLINGGIHLNYRVSDHGRYFLFFHQGGLSFHKQNLSGVVSDLTKHDENFDLGTWHAIEIKGTASYICVSVDNVPKMEYNDDQALLWGSIALESLPDSIVNVDEIEITGAPLAKPPSGYNYVWKRTGGPFGGTGYDIRIHPTNKNIMFVTDNPSGVNKSSDGGATWRQSNKGISADPDLYGDGAPIFSLTIDPNNPDNIWAGTQDENGIFKSTDCGETWTRKINGITEGGEISFRGFAVHPNNSNIVVAAAQIATQEDGFSSKKSKGKIYKTVDGGENWYKVWEGNNLARVLIYDYSNPNILYCSTGIFDVEAYNTDLSTNSPGGEGILKSVDGGENWVHINNGIDNPYIGFLEMHPTDSKILFAAAGNPELQNHFGIFGSLYKTVDAGATWNKIYQDHAYFSVVTISPSNPHIVYAGSDKAFYRSEDAGVSWTKFNNQETDYGYGPPGMTAGIPIGAVVHPDNPYIVIMNSYQGGNFMSHDGGETWIAASKGYTGVQLTDVTTNPNNPLLVYTIGRTGPFKSLNGGLEWVGLGYDSAIGPMDWHQIIINPSDPNELLLSDQTAGRILKSTNGGRNWRVVFSHPLVDGFDPENYHGFKALSYAPSNSNIIFGGMCKISGGGHIIEIDPSIGASFGVYKSNDRGETWIEKNSGLESSMKSINVIAVHPSNANIAYVGTLHDGIYKTMNCGDTWVRKSNGLGSTDIRSLSINPKNPSTLYAGAGDGTGIFVSRDGGELWTESNKGIQLECPSYLKPSGGTVIGVSLSSPDLNATSIYSASALPWTRILDIVVDPINTSRIFAADLNIGVYVSEDEGKEWNQINDGLSIKSVTCLSISSKGEILYAGTYGAGIHKINLSGFLYVDSSNSCGSKTPCYSTIQEAINLASTGSAIRIAQGSYTESIVLNESKSLTLQGGWDSTFTTQTSNTVINSLTITGKDGSTEIDNIVLQ